MKYTAENTVGIGKLKKCFVDGVEIHNVLECDTEKGYATYYLVDENRRVIINGREMATETIHGKVTVKDICPQDK